MDGTVPPSSTSSTARKPRVRPVGVSPAYRLAVVSRFMAATFGGYLLASLFSVCITLWVPLPRAEAVMTGMMLSFLAYLGAFIWCFACRTAWRAWGGVLLPCAVLGMAYGCARWLP